MAQNDFFTTAADRALAEQPSFGLPEFAKTERAPSSIPAGGAVPFQDVFNAAAQRYGVPVNVLMALGEQESRFNPTALGVPTKYGRAKGLMQYIDSTAAGMGINPYDPVQSIDAAARQLRDRLAKGYSMQEAVSAHFAGDDRKQWGPKTAVYGQEVLARAEKFLNGGKASVTQPTPGQQQNAAQPFDMSQEREAYPAAQSAMENMDQTRLRTQALLDEMNKEEPGRYRALTPDELAQLQQQAQGQQNQQPQEKVGNTDPTPLTTPGELPQGNKDGNLLLDSAILLTSGLNTAAKDAKELVSRIPYIGKPIVDAADRFDRWANGKGSEEIFKEWDKNVEASLSPEMVQARKGAWVVEPGDDLGNGKKATSYSFGPAWSDPRAYMSGILESLPEMAVTMGGAGRLASMSYKAALRAGASREVAAKAAARTATVAGGLLEGGLGGAQSAREVRDDINKMTPDQLKDSDALKALMSQGKTFEQARSELAENAATRAFVVAGIGTGLFGGMGDRAIAKIVTNRAGGRIRAAITGAIGEGLFEEVPQSVLQQGGQNYALQDADPSIPLTKGVANAAGGGLAIGATMGAGIGAAAPRAGTDEVNQQPEAAPVDTVDPTPTPAEASGPIGRAMQRGVPAAAPVETPTVEQEQAAQPAPVEQPAADAHEFMGPVGAATTVTPKEDPAGAFAGTVERYQDGDAIVRGEDGSVYQFGPGDVIPPDLQQAQTPQQEAQPATEIASNEGEKPEVGRVVEEERPATRTLDQMEEPELRERLKYLARQAKQTGWDNRLMAERRKVEAAIDAKTKQAVPGNDNEQSAPVSGETPADNAGAARSDVARAEPAAGETGPAAVAGNEQDMGAGGAADVASAGDRSLTTSQPAADAKVKWFGTAEKAKAYIDKKGLGDTHEVRPAGRSRFEVQPKGGNVQQNAEKVNPPAESVKGAPAAAATTKELTGAGPRYNRARKLVGEIGSAVSPSGDVGASVKAGRKYRIARIEKNGIVHLVDQENADSARISVAEMEAARSRNVAWNNVENSVAETAPKQPEKQRAPLNFDALPLLKEHREDPLIRRFAELADRVDRAEKDSDPATWTPEEKRAYESGNHEEFSRLRGYTASEIADFNEFVKLAGEVDAKYGENTAGGIDDLISRQFDEPAPETPKAEPKPAETATNQPETASEQTKTAENAPKNEYGATNKLVSQDRAAELRKKLKAKFSQLNSGLDPEILAIGTELAVFHLEAGVRKFADFARTMASDLDVPLNRLRPYLRSWYNGGRDMMEDSGISIDGMDSPETVRAELAKLNTEEQPQPVSQPAGSLDDMVAQFDREVTTDEPKRLDQPGQGALEGVPANPVQGAESQEPAGERAARRSGTDAPGNERAGSPGIQQPRSLGDDAREVSVPAGRGEPAAAGQRNEPGSETDAGRNGDRERAVRRERSRPVAGTVAEDRPVGAFTINADEIGKGGDKTKYRNNVAAIRLLKELEAANRPATREEQAILSKYVGWGGLPQAFERTDGSANKGWEKEVADLKALMTPEEYRAAQSSTKNAHYTSPEIVSGMWDAMRRLGFTGGRVIEPSVGVGNFFGLMPADVRAASALHGVELDHITSGIATQLYPEAKIARMGYQDYVIPDGYFDIAIGNPPFGADKLYDGRRKDLSGFNIHNYFFARSVDALRPGGVLGMVVTNRMLDSASDKARQYIADRADFLGAIRLPNNAFAKNAGTEVTTDIIFLRRRAEGEAPAGAQWMNTVDYTDKEGRTVPLNEYFAANPDMMLGDFGAYGSMYREGEPALVAREGQNTAAELAKAIARLPENIITRVESVKPETRATVAAENARVGSMFLDGDQVMIRRDDVMGESQGEAVSFPNEKARQRVTGMIGLRDHLADLRKLQLDPRADETRIEAARGRLNQVYDAFVKEFGPVNLDANKRLFRDDPTWPQISALEEGFDKGISAAVAKKTGEEARAPSASKAAIFSKRTQSPYSPPTSASTAKDALVTALAERGHVDMAMMSELYGKSEDEIARELGDLIFSDPNKGWVTRDEYLSGNVKAKLAQARERAQTDPAYARNVEALEAVQPKDIEAVDISVKPGASWLPADTMAAFANHIAETTDAKAFYNPVTAKWSFPGLNASAAAAARFGTGRMDVKSIIEAAAAQKSLQVYDNHPDGSRTLNETETQLANDKANAVREEFGRWIWSEDARRQTLARLYNDQFNTDVPRVYDGSHLTFPGKISDDIIRLRPHQGNAVWRIVQGGSTLTDHVVGAGKTFTLIAAAMELRRMGLARKPVFAVPNHLVGQWAADFVKLYPGANVLAATKKDFEKENRKRLFARIATGDWDAVIVAHSSFGKVQVDPQAEAEFIQEQIADLEASIEAIREAEGRSSRNVKDAAKRRDALQEKLKALLDTENKDDSLYWNELGIDALFVDEAHEFKNLAYSTSMRNVAGLGDTKGSQKAMDMFMKVRQVLKATGGRNVVFATGTPISNTMAEMYTMQRYLDYDTLQAQGLSHFDAWARMFGEVVTDWELSPSGKYKMNSRFAKFVNMPELMQRYTSFADVINRDDINRQLAAQGKKLPVPKVAGGKPTNVVVQRSQDQADYIGEPVKDADGNDTDQYPRGTLVWRSENLPKRPEKGADNMLKIMSDARKAALDMRLIDPRYPDHPHSKVNEAADRILGHYQKWHDDRGTQLVFIDLSTPKNAKAGEAARLRDLAERADNGDEDAIAALDKISPDELLALESDFSVYDDLKQKLIARGIPEAEVAFIHDAKTELQKEELFGKVRTGRIRVLLGSTAKMGAGMNVQDRLVALHHLDAPWRPSDLEQREGRIIRQGNKLYERDPDGFEVNIERYATKQTLDSRMWQTIEGKANFIEQVRKGNTGVREIEDVGGEAANAAEMKAASSGNPLILEEMTLRQRIRRLENERTGHDREQFRIRDSIQYQQKRAVYAEREIADLQQDVKRAQPAEFAMTIGNETFDKRKDAGEAILAAAANMEQNGIAEQDIGSYGDFTLHLYRLSAEQYEITVQGAGAYTAKFGLGADPVGTAMRVTNAVKDLGGAIEKMEQARDQAQATVPKLQEQLADWPKDAELNEARTRHAEVLEQLKPKKKESAPSVANPETPAQEQQYNDFDTGFAADFMTELAANDTLFAYPRATGQQTLQGVFDTVMPDVQIKWSAPQLDDNSSETGVEHIRGVTGRGRDINIYQTPEEVWFDVSNVNEGEGGSGIYQAVADYALNTGRVFIGDPDGLSDIALRRRTEAMLSSALKHGTTDHLQPHERQLQGDKALGVPPLRWKEGDFAFNIRSLIDTSLASIKSAVPEIDRARYDFNTGTYRTGNGDPILAGMLRSWSEHPKLREARAGSATIRRSILLNTLARTESGSQSGLLERLFRVGTEFLAPQLQNTFYDADPTGTRWGEDRYSRLPEGNRIQVANRLRRLERMQAKGTISPEEYTREVSSIASWLENRSQQNAMNRAFAERQRGEDMVLERLHRARRQGDLSENAADMAIWFVRNNPQLVDDLGLSISSRGGSRYDRAERIARLMKEGMRDTTPVHEILHHTERMMPADIQKGIVGEYNRAWRRAYRDASPEVRAALDALRLSAWGDKAAREAAMKAFQNGTLNYDEHYQLTNPSEFWAVNAARIVEGRHSAEKAGWVARAKRWLQEFVEQAKSIFRLPSDAPVIRALSSLAKGDGSFQTQTMLGVHPLADQPVMRGASQEANDLPNSGLERDPNPPSTADNDGMIKRWWDTTKNWTSDKLTQSMPKLLATVPMRPLVRELGRNLAGAADYMRLKQSMDAMRSEWHAKTDKVAQRWLKYRVANKAENAELMDLMHEATRVQVDPSEKFAPLMTDRERDALRTAPINSSQYETLVKKAAQDKKRREAHRSLQERWNKLSPEAREIYIEVRDTYKAMADAYEGILLKNMEKAINVRIKKAEREHRADMEEIADLGLTGQEKQDAIDKANGRLRAAKTKISWNRKARITQLRQQFEMERLAGPYFPLARFGNFFVTVRNKQEGFVESFSRFEDVTAQRKFANMMRQNPNYEVEVGALDDTASVRKAVDPNFVADVEDILADLPNADKVKDEVWQRYLETLPDLSVRKNRIHRKGRAGFDADALRAFGNQMFHGSHQLARLAHSFDMEEAIDQAREEARHTNDPVRDTLVVNEIAKRHEFVMNPTGGSIAQAITSAAFIYHLSVSPAAAMVNMSQTVIIGVPILAAYNGGAKGFTRASNQLMKALRDFTVGRGYAERSKYLTADEKQAMEQGYNTGVIDRTQSHDLAGVGETGVEYSPKRAKAMAAISWAFHHTERLNREVTYLAAYRMARAKGESHAQAINTAGDLTWKTHFDYQNTSRPRVMHSDTAKALLVFRNYNVNMLWRLFRDTHQALNGESKEIRREAFTQLAGITGMMMANAGIKGTWLFGIAMVLAGMFLDDGDDPEVELKKAMVKSIGPMMAGIALDGIPGYITGTSLSERIGMPDLWFRSPDRQLEGQDEYNYWQTQALGAAPGIIQNAMRGFQMMQQDQTYRGIETLAPKVIKDLMRAYRYQTEGVTTLKGDKLLDEVTPWETFVQALGFTPAALAERYDINNANMNKQKFILGERKKLLDRYARADKAGDEKALERIEGDMDKFSAKYPEQEITEKAIRNSLRSRERNRENNDGGMLYNNRLRDRILEEQSPTVYR